MEETRRIHALNAFEGDAGDLADEIAGLVRRRDKVLGREAVLFYDRPVHVARAEGVFLYDAHGAAYLDAYNNVPSVGHSHPRVAAAIARQAGALTTHARYLHGGIEEYAERLLATVPPGIRRVAFTCTGSESADLALRLARHHTGAQGIVVTANAYHGSTGAVSEISPAYGPAVPLGHAVRAIPAPDPLRRPAEDAGRRLAEDLRHAVADLARHGVAFAAFAADTILASDGIHADPPGLLAPAVAAAREAGGLFIADEVQPGFARTGTHMWGFERHGVVPDFVIMGKAMGNGYPVAGLAVRPDILAAFSRQSGYFNTYGGNPVAAAAGLAVLDVLEEEGLRDNARAVGAYLRAGLRDLAARVPAIGDVRGAGLYLGVELCCGQGRPDAARARRIVNGLRARRVLIGVTGPYGNVLKIRPPLCFSRAHADTLLAAAEAAFADG